MPPAAAPVPPSWPAAWVRAALPAAILAVLEQEPLHGYGIATALEARGFGRPRGGSLYPLLAALEDEGQVTADWAPGAAGPGRRVYRLTDGGRASLARQREDWRALTAALQDSDVGANITPTDPVTPDAPARDAAGGPAPHSAPHPASSTGSWTTLRRETRP